jgi:uncharacterized protein YkwD
MRHLSQTAKLCLVGVVVTLSLVFLINSIMIPRIGGPETDNAGQTPLKNSSEAPLHSTTLVIQNIVSPNLSPPTISLSPVQTPVQTMVLSQPPVIKTSTSPTRTLTDVTAASHNPYSIDTSDLSQRVHVLVNRQRSDQGLAELVFDPTLANIALKHSQDMAAQHYIAHENPAGQNPTERGIAAGYLCRKDYGTYYTYGIAENLFQNNLYSSTIYYSNRETVYNWNSPEEIARSTVAGWMNSSGHRKNILTPTFDREGIGVAIASDDKVYITENFC